MRDPRLLIASFGAVLVLSWSSSTVQALSGEEPVRMAADSLVVKSYKESDSSSTSSSTITVSPDDGTEYQIYQGVMGRPGIDFPVFPHIPATDFNCRDIKHSGYYADLSTDCQVFHICDGGRKISFLCPNGTIFRQSHLICDWWFRVDCGKSVELYEESAEQLAADQKVYKERSEERERRRKLVKTSLGDTEDELLGSEVYALDEPYDIRSRAPSVTSSSVPAATQASVSVVTSVRMQEERRVGERHSKRVLDSRMEEKFPSYSRVGKSDRAYDKPIGEIPRPEDRKPHLTEKISIVHGRPAEVHTFTGLTEPHRVPTPTTTPHAPIHPVFVHKTRFLGRNSVPASTKASIHEPAPEADPRERQHLAETASFAARGGRTFAEFPQNQFNQFTQYQKPSTASTERATQSNTPLLIRVTEAPSTSPSTKVKKPDERFKVTQVYSTSPAYKATVPLIKTTPRPKQNSKKVTTVPFPTTLREVEVERLRNATKRVPIENIYFTTALPETESPSSTTQASPSTPEVMLSLQELNIHKAETQINDTSSFDNNSREGLDVPPSSGPSALRSFALYFAGAETLRGTNGRAVPFISKDVLIIPITRNLERKINRIAEAKQKDVVKQVDEIVHDSTQAQLPVEKKAPELPRELRNQTKESYSALFSNATAPPPLPSQSGGMSDRADFATESDFGTTAFESYTEEPVKINSELAKNDLHGSQSRGIVEPEQNSVQLNDQFSKVSPDLRELAQIFTKALSAYLDDPEAFRRVLSEIRPTEPSSVTNGISPNPIEYPSATQEDDEVLDFSDVTKATFKKKTTEGSGFRETTTEYTTEPPTTVRNDAENLVLPLSVNGAPRAPALDLIAPLESLDESQSSYYTPSPNVIGTTNAIAEEINNEFSPGDKLPDIDSNEAVDTYFPVTGSVDDPSRPRYGGFQNNSRATTKYSPYGAELTTTLRPVDLTTTDSYTTTNTYEERITTFSPKIKSTLYEQLKIEEAVKNQTEEEIALARELNGLAVSPVTSRSSSRGGKSYNGKEVTEPVGAHRFAQYRRTSTVEPVTEFQSVRLGNGETLERTFSRGVASRSQVTQGPEQGETNPQEINLELSPPFNTDPKGFLITYALERGLTTQASYLPRRETTTEYTTETTTQYVPTTERLTTLIDQSETLLPTTYNPDNLVNKYTRETKYVTTTEALTTTTQKVTKTQAVKKPKSLERLMELQETLMFNTPNITVQQKETARVSVEETMSNMTMTDTTANTLMKMMELAAKNETYRRLVLLLVNDKSGKNKTVEEARLSLLRALLTPVIGTRTRVRRPHHETLHSESSSSLQARRRTNFRRYKSLNLTTAANEVGTTPVPTTYKRITTVGPGRTTVRDMKKERTLPRIVKTTAAPTTTTEKPSTVFGSLGFIRKTIEDSKAKDVRINSLDDAILDSDSRAIELLRSLYSLAARWG